jgi:hypothetical protein
MYIQVAPVEIRTPEHWNLIGPQHISPAACVTVQEYSSTTFTNVH